MIQPTDRAIQLDLVKNLPIPAASFTYEGPAEPPIVHAERDPTLQELFGTYLAGALMWSPLATVLCFGPVTTALWILGAQWAEAAETSFAALLLAHESAWIIALAVWLSRHVATSARASRPLA